MYKILVSTYPSIAVLIITQVVWLGTPTMKTSWEPASTLPSSLVEDYEKGASGDVLESFSSGGQTIHTMSTTPGGANEPKSKKMKCMGSKETDEDTGYIMFSNT